MAVIDLESGPEDRTSAEGIDFESTIKKPERLRKERLISEEAYWQEREEIMAKKW